MVMVSIRNLPVQGLYKKYFTDWCRDTCWLSPRFKIGDDMLSLGLKYGVRGKGGHKWVVT
jgi:hypothetical protein